MKESYERYRPEKSEVYRLCASIEKAQDLLGYSPEVTLETGLEETIQWFTSRLTTNQETVSLYHV